MGCAAERPSLTHPRSREDAVSQEALKTGQEQEAPELAAAAAAEEEEAANRKAAEDAKQVEEEARKKKTEEDAMKKQEQEVQPHYICGS